MAPTVASWETSGFYEVPVRHLRRGSAQGGILIWPSIFGVDSSIPSSSLKSFHPAAEIAEAGASVMRIACALVPLHFSKLVAEVLSLQAYASSPDASPKTFLYITLEW